MQSIENIESVLQLCHSVKQAFEHTKPLNTEKKEFLRNNSCSPDIKKNMNKKCLFCQYRAIKTYDDEYICAQITCKIRALHLWTQQIK